MKTIQLSTRSLLVALAAWCAGASSANATPITWGAAQNVTGASDVLNTGTPVYAYAFGTDVGAQTVNGVAFAVGGIGGGGTNVTITGGQACGPYFPLSSPAGYNGILKGAVFANNASGAVMTATLKNLVEGQEYAVQVWSGNVDYGGSNVTYDGSVSLSQTIGQFAIGTFIADATGSQVIVLTGINCQFNAIQVRTVPVNGTPPTVAITSPADTATVGINFTVNATASDDGTVTDVAFYDGATLLGNDNTGPDYSYAWNGAPEGAHVLTAKAWDNNGMTTTSAEVNVTVIDPPTVAITSPTNNTTMGVNFTIDAAATDNGTVTSVDFYDGATLLGSDDTGPAYSYAWNGAPEGPHVLTAVAWDNDGHSATSAVVNVTATNITWGAAHNIVGDSDVLSTGTSVYAYAFGNTNQPTWPVAVNGVDFAYASQNGGGTNVTLGVPSPSTRVAGPYFGGMGGLSAGYTAILKGGFWCHTPFALYSLNLNNLTAGTEYAVQVWSLSPVAYGSQNITLDGVTLSSHDGTGTGQYLIGSFTATATTQTISVGPATNAMGPLCAVQVRTVPAPGTPPTVAITSPADNATVGVNFTIDATATDDGTITKVSFFDGTTQLGPDVTDPPYSYAWNGVPEGPHVLTAVAWDNDGHSATSAVVNVTVTNITWGAAQNIAGDSDVIITGTSVYAYHFGNGGPHSLNGVSFAAASTGGGGTDITIGGGAPPLFAGPYFGGAPALSAEYTTILLGGLYTASPFGLYSLMLNNLTSGTVYAVQVWSKSPYAGQHITLDGPANDLLSHNGTGQHMIGTFTATSATQTITVGPGVGDNTGGPLCAVQVRTVSGVAGYDAWSEQIPAGHRGRTDDPDGDGFTNLQEFLFGTSPIAGNGALVSSETVGGNCVLHWRQRETGAGYLLKESTTLDPGDWVTCAVVPQLDDQTGAPTDYDRYQASIPIDAARKFFRVEGREN